MGSEDNLEILKNKYEAGKLSHAFLIETNNMDLTIEDLKQFVKYINCFTSYKDNCTECNLCRLVDLGNLPSLVIIEPDGMSIKKNQLQELQEKFSSKPVYSKYNIYIIVNAELMNPSSANSILKFLEEPTDHIIGFLLTNNKEKMLSTIISRCQNMKFIYQEKTFNEEINILADEYLKQIREKKSIIVNKQLILPVLKSRQELNDLFLEILHIYLKKIKENYFPGNNSVDKKIENYNKQLEIINKVLTMIKQNVNMELVLDFFVIEMRKFCE